MTIVVGQQPPSLVVCADKPHRQCSGRHAKVKDMNRPAIEVLQLPTDKEVHGLYFDAWRKQIREIVKEEPGPVINTPANNWQILSSPYDGHYAWLHLPNQTSIKVPWQMYTPEEVVGFLYTESLIPGTDKLEALYGPRQQKGL